ncbi:hypothetical protein [Nostoc sp.]|uniref:hypothetical protein n=1 Tax=Nostoc sp. TaxID=1180 RepID=UPI002FF9D694
MYKRDIIAGAYSKYLSLRCIFFYLSRLKPCFCLKNVQVSLGQGSFGNTFEVDERGKTKVLKMLTENNPKAIELFK